MTVEHEMTNEFVICPGNLIIRDVKASGSSWRIERLDYFPPGSSRSGEGSTVASSSGGSICKAVKLSSPTT